MFMFPNHLPPQGILVRKPAVRRAAIAGTCVIAAFGVPDQGGILSPTDATAAVRKCSEATPPESRPILYPGDKGSCVRVMQRGLVRLGRLAPSGVDGVFGPGTAGEVASFQIQLGLRGTDGTLPTRNVGRLTWRALNNGQDFRGIPTACTEVGKSICISKEENLTRLIVNGRTTMRLASRFGDTRAPRFRTDEGVFSVQSKSIDHRSSLYNGAWMPFAIFYNGDEAVHFSPDFAADPVVNPGEGSHGCVNVSSFKGARALFNKVPEGTRVVVY